MLTGTRKSIGLWIYIIVLSVLFGGMSAGQILGFAGVYNAGLAWALAFILSGFCLFLLFRHGRLGHIFDHETSVASEFIAFDRFASIIGAVLITIILIVPLIRWPSTPIANELTWDAGLYHFPKAVELNRTGSVWDLSIPYGQYPFGYESLLALGLGLIGNFLFAGWVHALIAIFFSLSLWLLFRRFTRLPPGVLLLITSLILVSGSWISRSRLYLLTSYTQIVGKNDILLAGAVLSVIFLSPISVKKEGIGFSPIPLAIASAVSLSVKVNGWWVLVLAWIALLIHLWRREKSSADRFKEVVVSLISAGLLIIPSFLWVIRNLFIMGMVFSPGVRSYMNWSIGYNFGNPNLYAVTPTFLILLVVIGLLIVSVITSLRIGKPVWSTTLTLAVLLLAFIYTPVSAFLGSVDEPAHIAWRFGSALLAFSVLVFIQFIEPWLLKLIVCIQKKRENQLFGSLIIAGLAIFTVWNAFWLMADSPQNAIILEDQFTHPVGVDGYYSAYDYVQRNIQDSVIQIENGLPIYLYGPDFSNTPTKLQYPVGAADLVEQPEPQYFVIFRTVWQENSDSLEGKFPDYLDSESWDEKWSLIYRDDQGRVYQRKRQ